MMADNPMVLTLILLVGIAVTIYNITSLISLMNNPKADPERLGIIVPGRIITICFLVFLIIVTAVLLVDAL